MAGLYTRQSVGMAALVQQLQYEFRPYEIYARQKSALKERFPDVTWVLRVALRPPQPVAAFSPHGLTQASLRTAGPDATLMIIRLVAGLVGPRHEVVLCILHQSPPALLAFRSAFSCVCVWYLHDGSCCQVPQASHADVRSCRPSVAKVRFQSAFPLMSLRLSFPPRSTPSGPALTSLLLLWLAAGMCTRSVLEPRALA